MKIVIDIPKDVIESAKSSPNYYPTYHFEKIWRAIAKGAVLPKGHGRLIDADKEIAGLKEMKVEDEKDKQSVRFAILELKYVDTIIEADKAEGSEVKE